MDPQATLPEESSYQIVSYKGENLPKEYQMVVRDPFFTGLRCGNDYFKLIDYEAYKNVYGKYIGALLNKPKTIIRLAQLKDKTVLGWAMLEDKALHYVWVKSEVRGQGIAKALVPKDTTQFTHITNKGISIWSRDNYKHLRFNPFI